MTQKGRQAMKKLLSIIMMASMIVTLTPIACGGALTQSTAYADTTSVTVDNLEYTINEQSKTATVVGFSDTVSSDTYIAVIIPSTISNNGNTYKVTKIKNYAFYADKTQNEHYKEINDKIASVIFEDESQLENIGNYAFCGCNKLRTINIPAGVESIGTQAFKDCSRLTTITFEEGSNLKDIKDKAFMNCNMSTITIPASVTKIGDDAFYMCGNLTKVTFEDGSGLETIENSAFRDCRKLATINFGGTKEQWDALKVTLPTLTTGTTTVKMSQAAPSAVKEDTIEYNTITLKKIDKSTTTGAEAEYRIANGEWQDDMTFTGLTADTTYTFEARYKAITVTDTTATIDYAPSDAVSASLTTASDSSSGTGDSGGSSGSSVQKPTVVPPTNGTITILSDGTTAVIRPNVGYEVASVILNGEDKGTFPVLMNLKSNDKVEATFQKTKETLDTETKAAVASLSTLKARSSKTANGNIKVVAKLSTAEKAKLAELTSQGYTVKYKFYRSTKKSSSYKPMLEKSSPTYINTYGKSGTRYYYKARVMVYDADGTLIAKSALKQCKYASRIK